MNRIGIEGGRRLCGSLRVQGAKNSVLPLMAATILHPGTSVLRGCPRLSDVDVGIRILEHLGCRVCWEGNDLQINTTSMGRWDIPDTLMREMRSSVIFLGAILTRFGWVEMSYPGGCELGPRPIDLHLKAMQTLGARVQERGGRILCDAQQLTGGEITLSLPSVGATENAMLAACGGRGESVICNAAREPEIVDLQNFLRAMGYEVHGAGGSVISVRGQCDTRDAVHTVMPDRIAAATWLAAAAAAGGEVELTGINYRYLSTVTAALLEAGCRIVGEEDRICLCSSGDLRGIRAVRTAPYPGFPTDAQAVLMAALLRSRGATVFVENLIENRYRHVDELRRMGADINVADRVAVVSGVPVLHGADVRATDLRGGAALLVAGMAAEGTTRIDHIHHILRGYEDPVGQLRSLGAAIWLEEETE